MKIKSVILFLLALFISINAFAKQSPVKVYPITGSTLMGLTTGGTPMSLTLVAPGVDPNHLSLLNTADKITSYQNTIELVLKNQSALDEDAKVTIKAEITYHLIDGSVEGPKTITLEVDFKSGALQKSNISNLFAFTNAYQVDISVNDVKLVGASGYDPNQLKAKLKGIIELDVTFQEESFTRIDYNTVVKKLNACKDAFTDELIINWSPVDDDKGYAEEYEIEYTYADDYTSDYSSKILPNQISYDFKKNSTRISTKDPYYRVPLLFERGYILYRVRVIGRGGTNLDLPVHCIWSGPADNGLVSNFPNNYYHDLAHMKDKINYQVTSTFVEDGKRSDVVNYYDGTFRSRQTVTGTNLEKKDLRFLDPNYMTRYDGCILPGTEKEREVIAGETIYDYQGRPSVNILPVPTNDLKIEYINLLNISFNSHKPYNYIDFDKSNCELSNALDQALNPHGIMGASSYYYDTNPNKSGFNAFIPYAFGYPFTQLRYTPDNTGRVSVQGGLNNTFQLESGHETKFFYGSPNQQELDRLFGTEVGDAKRYKKNAVMDPNGQVSVTYINPEGKTIATALAGDTPRNLEALSDQKNTNHIDVSLINKNVKDTIDRTLITEHQFLVTAKTEYKFDYQFIPEVLTTTKCDGKEVSLDGIYDIDITLKKLEGCSDDPVVSDKLPGTIGELLDHKTNLPDLLHDNNVNTGTYPRTFTKDLDIGSYMLTKKITVNKQAGIDYVNEVFKDTCQDKWHEILNEELLRVDTLKCYNSCLDCEQPPVQTPTCNTAYCAPWPNRCDVINGMLLADISPGGQYAQFDRINGIVDATAYPLSIFNPNNKLPYNTPNQGISYINTLLQLPAGTNVTTIVNNWLPGYGDKLKKLHPEACMSGWCGESGIDQTLNFDVDILSANSYSDAFKKEYIDPANGNIALQLLNLDAGLNNSPISQYRSNLSDNLLLYGCGTQKKPIDVIAMEMAWCAFNSPPQNMQGTPQINSPSTNCMQNYPVHVFGSMNIPPAPGKPSLADLEWTFLRALYISAKNTVLQADMNRYAFENQCNNKCIGEPFNWAPNIFGNSIYFAPCNNTGTDYAKKKIRFGSEVRSSFEAANNSGVSIDFSGVDFNDPCQVVQAVQNQTGSINQQFSSIYCGDKQGTPCEVTTGLTTVINTILNQLKLSPTVTLTPQQIPQSVINAGINIISATNEEFPGIRINFRPCGSFIDLPYTYIDTVTIAPTSVCCISNISCPNNGNCSFDMKVSYANNTTQTLHFNTTCNFLKDCKTTEGNTCNKPSIYSSEIKDYLNAIIQYNADHQKEPSPVELLNMLPAHLQEKNGITAKSVTANFSGDLSICINYTETHISNQGTYKQKKLSSKVSKEVSEYKIILPKRENKESCCIVLQGNDKISSWSDIKGIVDIKPDNNSGLNGITNGFRATLVIVNDKKVSTVEVKGNSSCWPMNECPPEHTLCDSLPKMPAFTYVNDCSNGLIATAHNNASIRYNTWLDSMKNDLLQRYYSKCLKAVETLSMHYFDKQYQYTLYYYDQADNLVKTVPPAGVHFLDEEELKKVENSRLDNYSKQVLPKDSKISDYTYNTLNELVKQETPDAGETNFYYDALGRISASQNAEQNEQGNFSYTRYDEQGRNVESGKIHTDVINSAFTRDFDNWKTFINGSLARSEITFTRYDETLPAINLKFGTSGQRNLRKRVASVLSFKNSEDLHHNDYTHATHFSYDIMGNVYKLIQDYPNDIIGDKSIEYSYDLQSGKVNSVIYQAGAPDEFIHKYTYDALNRLLRVKTSPNGLKWETDAEYFYYRHGPLARIELGTDKVQGLDYIYTLQGWIKGVNGTTTSPETDMGQDGIAGNNMSGPGYGALHSPIALDAFGYVLSYFGNDYLPISYNTSFLDALDSRVGTVKGLGNGNISRMYTQIQKLGNMGFNYSYDQLNRFISQEGWKLDKDGKNMQLIGDAYNMKMKYDADGNIVSLTRNGDSKELNMDEQQYHYYKNDNVHTYDPLSGVSLDATNRLAYVTDEVPDGNYNIDIDEQKKNNYHYNAIGNLIGDDAEGISQIDWTLQNKIKTITKNNETTIDFQYDSFGNRVMKADYKANPQQNLFTYYVRDAKGNIMATYSYKVPENTTKQKLYLDELNIYGSSRLGVYKPEIEIPKMFPISGLVGDNHKGIILHLRNENIYDGAIYGNDFTAENTQNKGTGTYLKINRGYKQYELANHLGNVLATITDRKLPITGTTTYTADLSTAQDYYPFGMLMPGRNFSSGNYNFGFNGKENDNEVKGIGDQQDYGMRIYDPRLGKFLSVDPLTKKYPWYTPYQFAGNKPIQCIDLDGGEPKEKNKIEDDIEKPNVVDWVEEKLGEEIFDYYKEKAEKYFFNTTAAELESKLLGVSEEVLGKFFMVAGFVLTPSNDYQGHFNEMPSLESRIRAGEFNHDIPIIPTSPKQPLINDNAVNRKRNTRIHHERKPHMEVMMPTINVMLDEAKNEPMKVTERVIPQIKMYPKKSWWTKVKEWVQKEIKKVPHGGTKNGKSGF